MFADGAQLSKGRAASDEGLSPDKNGLVRLSLSRPGGYSLKLKGIPVANFRVEKTKPGLRIRGLPTAAKLLFTHLLELRPYRNALPEATWGTGMISDAEGHRTRRLGRLVANFHVEARN